jgi:hypothetical protein
MRLLPPKRRFDLRTETPEDVARAIIRIEDGDEIATYARILLAVFVRSLAKRRRQISIEQLRDVVEQPPNELFPQLTDVMKTVPKRLSAAVLTVVRSEVRRACEKDAGDAELAVSD